MTDSNLGFIALVIGGAIIIAGMFDGHNLFNRQCQEAGGYTVYSAGTKLCINPSAIIQLRQ